MSRSFEIRPVPKPPEPLGEVELTLWKLLLIHLGAGEGWSPESVKLVNDERTLGYLAGIGETAKMYSSSDLFHEANYLYQCLIKHGSVEIVVVV